LVPAKAPTDSAGPFSELDRGRKPGQSKSTTPARRRPGSEFLSGRSMGDPLERLIAMLVRNKINARRLHDMRGPSPSHASHVQTSTNRSPARGERSSRRETIAWGGGCRRGDRQQLLAPHPKKKIFFGGGQKAPVEVIACKRASTQRNGHRSQPCDLEREATCAALQPVPT